MTAHDSDFELLHAWRGGDRTAGGRLIERHHPTLFRFFQTKAPADAEDLVQRAFEVAVQRKDSIAALDRFRPYLLAVARSVLVDHFRRDGRHRRRFDPLQTSAAAMDPTPSQWAAQQQERRLVIEALRRIPLDLQVALELFYWEGLAGAEIGEVLGVPEGTVRTRLRRARQLLKSAIAELAEGDPRLGASAITALTGRDRVL